MHLAVAFNRRDMADFFSHHYNPNHVNQSGQTPLNMAFVSGDKSIYNLLKTGSEAFESKKPAQNSQLTQRNLNQISGEEKVRSTEAQSDDSSSKLSYEIIERLEEDYDMMENSPTSSISGGGASNLAEPNKIKGLQNNH